MYLEPEDIPALREQPITREILESLKDLYLRNRERDRRMYPILPGWHTIPTRCMYCLESLHCYENSFCDACSKAFFDAEGNLLEWVPPAMPDHLKETVFMESVEAEIMLNTYTCANCEKKITKYCMLLRDGEPHRVCETCWDAVVGNPDWPEFKKLV